MNFNLDLSPRRYTNPDRVRIFADNLAAAGITFVERDGRLWAVGDIATCYLQDEVDKRADTLRALIADGWQPVQQAATGTAPAPSGHATAQDVAFVNGIANAKANAAKAEQRQAKRNAERYQVPSMSDILREITK